MFLETASVSSLKVTLGALIRTLSRMRQVVLLKTVLGPIARGALVALERSFTRVFQHMPSERLVIFVLLRTDLALERHFSGVVEHMSLKTTGLNKRLPANVTLVRSNARVKAAVDTQTILTGERDSTYGAYEWTLPSVDSLMIDQNLQTANDLEADVALHLLLPSLEFRPFRISFQLVDLEVHVKPHLRRELAATLYAFECVPSVVHTFVAPQRTHSSETRTAEVTRVQCIFISRFGRFNYRLVDFIILFV